MGSKRFIIAALLGLAVAIPSKSVNLEDVNDEISNFGVWTSIGVEKKITKKWSIGLEGEFRTQDALNEVSRYSLGISTDYKISSWLKADAGYIFLRDYNRKTSSLELKDEEDDCVVYELDNNSDFWRNRHRVNASLTGSVKLGDFKFSLRERWQYTYQPEVSYDKTEYDVEQYNIDDWGWAQESMGLVEYNGYLWSISDEAKEKRATKQSKNSYVLRSRIQVEYDKKGLPVEPYASCEIYNGEGWHLKKTRYTIGADYKITKKHSVGLYYRYQAFAGDDSDESTQIIGVGYKFKF